MNGCFCSRHDGCAGCERNSLCIVIVCTAHGSELVFVFPSCDFVYSSNVPNSAAPALLVLELLAKDQVLAELVHTFSSVFVCSCKVFVWAAYDGFAWEVLEGWRKSFVAGCIVYMFFRRNMCVGGILVDSTFPESW